jgi:general stress protein YciG
MEKSKRGLAAMDPEKRREIQQMGGRSVAAENRAYSKDKKLARESGQRGGFRKAIKERLRAQEVDDVI